MASAFSTRWAARGAGRQPRPRPSAPSWTSSPSRRPGTGRRAARSPSPRPAGSGWRSRCRPTAVTAAAGTARAARRRSASSRRPTASSATATRPSPGRARSTLADVAGAVDEGDVLGRLAAGADDLLVTLVADQQDVEVVVGEPAGLVVHLRHQRAGGVDRPQAAGGGLLVDLRRDAVGGEHDDRALGHLGRSPRRRSRRAPRGTARRAGCARSACGRRPARRSARAPARRSAPRGRRRRSSPRGLASRTRLARVAAERLCAIPAMVRTPPMRQAGVMQLPGPVRAAVGLVGGRRRRGEAAARPRDRTADARRQHRPAGLAARPAALRAADRPR